MYSRTEYALKLPPRSDPAFAEHVFGLVWRFDFDAPGFCLLDAGPGVDSHALRRAMLTFKAGLSAACSRRTGPPLLFRSLGRFDQRETTKYHLDGGPDQSLLLLGYEPSQVHSRLFLADYARASFDLGITPERFLADYNPMFRAGEELLGRYATELPQPGPGQARILVINNSSLPFTEARTNPLGVMHRAVIVTPDETLRRVVNSAMLATEGEEIIAEKQEKFVSTDRISRKAY